MTGLFLQRGRGFTLIELMVALSLFAVFMGIAGTTYLRQKHHFDYNQSVLQVAELMKTTRGNALTSRPALPDAPSPPLGGYGLYMNQGTGQFTLFANNQAVGTEGSDGFDEADTVVIRYDLPRASVLESLTGDDAEAPAAEAILLFRPLTAAAELSLKKTNAFEPQNQLALRFHEEGAPTSIPRQELSINRVSGFPEIRRLTPPSTP